MSGNYYVHISTVIECMKIKAELFLHSFAGIEL